jgi:endoglucanase
MSVSPASPPVSRSYYVDPGNPAAKQAAEWRRSGRVEDADAMDELARQPTATWIADGVHVSARVRALVVAASRAHQTALLVAYYIPGRDCGQFSAGGAPSADAYHEWVSTFAGAIGGGSATVIVEPDAVAHAVSGDCVPGDQLASRYALLRFAVESFSRLPNTKVYLDAGHAGWVQPPTKLVPALRESGIGSATGFALNVSNFYATDASITYGNELSKALGGAHFVIDTSRNGNPLVDAYLWIKVPGESDGACRPGAPAAGVWWPDYALSLVRNQ